MIFHLHDEDIVFPLPELAEEDGLLAIGGNLSPQRLLNAYQHGIFPWYSEETPILWYSPHERFVLFPNRIKISKSMKQVMRSKKFTMTFDEDFSSVIKACASISRVDQDGTWITNEMQQAYTDLYELGYAHSVEVWENETLVGGLYGVIVNNIFCGESMFSKVNNASKVALIWLCDKGDFDLIDCQIYSEHLERLGAELMPREEYIKILRQEKKETTTY